MQLAVLDTAKSTFPPGCMETGSLLLHTGILLHVEMVKEAVRAGPLA